MVSIILDPGHGGSDPGAVYKNYQEKVFTLKISYLLKNQIENKYKNVIVYLTRTGDEDVSLKQRYTMSNQLKPSLFISIHCNAGGGSGFESYLKQHPSENEVFYRDVIHNSIALLNKKYNLIDRGKKIRDMDVTTYNLYPAMLLEVLFIDNPQDLKFLIDDNYLQEWCSVVASAIASIFKLESKVVTPTIQPTPAPEKPIEEVTPPPKYKEISEEIINIENKIKDVKNRISNIFDEVISKIGELIKKLS
jgi:N-acetylmuramoyl-L-alanine amidase